MKTGGRPSAIGIAPADVVDVLVYVVVLNLAVEYVPSVISEGFTLHCSLPSADLCRRSERRAAPWWSRRGTPRAPTWALLPCPRRDGDFFPGPNSDSVSILERPG